MGGEAVDQTGDRGLGHGYQAALPRLGFGFVEHDCFADAADPGVEGGASGGARAGVEGVAEREDLGIAPGQQGRGHPEGRAESVAPKVRQHPYRPTVNRSKPSASGPRLKGMRCPVVAGSRGRSRRRSTPLTETATPDQLDPIVEECVGLGPATLRDVTRELSCRADDGIPIPAAPRSGLCLGEEGGLRPEARLDRPGSAGDLIGCHQGALIPRRCGGREHFARVDERFGDHTAVVVGV